MREDFYFYKGNKYVIEDYVIVKIINNKRVKLNAQEYKEIEEFISSIQRDIFSNARLNEIAKKNDELRRIDCMPEVLEAIENYIPLEWRDDFYTNLESLHFEIGGFEDDFEDKIDSAGYNCIDNTITIYGSTLAFMKSLCADWKLPIDDYYLFIKHAFTHELLHMASRRVDAKTGKIYTGIITHPTDDLLEANVPFDEAITEILAGYITPSDIALYSSSYDSYMYVGYQIGILLGGKALEEAYFLNKGTDSIVDALDKIEYFPEKAEAMLYTFAEADLSESENTNIYKLLSVQDMLIDYYLAKLKQCVIDKDFETITKLVHALYTFLLREGSFNPKTVTLNKKCKNKINKNRNKLFKVLKPYLEFLPVEEDIKQKIKEVE